MQLRVAGAGGAFALDFGAVMTVGTARRVDIEMLSDALPAVSEAIVVSMARDGAGDAEPETE